MRAKRSFIAVAAAFFLLPLYFISTPQASAENPPRKILTGWIPYYRTYSSPGKSNGGLDSVLASPDLIKEVMPFWYSLDSATKITDLYTPANPNKTIGETLNSLKLAGFLIIPTITDGTASKDPKTGKTSTMVLSNLMADSAKRDVLVTTITDFVLKNNYDGIDLDFENFAYVDGTSSWATTQVRFIAFIKALASSLHAQNKLLSLTTPPLFDPAIGKKGYWVYSWPDLGSVIDRLRIMTYDYSTSTPGPIGPITWVEQTVQWAVKTVPASKVFIGLPGYGRDWIVAVDGICPSKPINYLGTIKTTASAGTFVMRDAAGLATTYGAIPSYQAKYGETTFTYKKQYDGTTADGQLTTCTATRTVWYQDAQGFGLRANLVAKYRLGGLTQWTLGMEDPAATEAIRVVAKSIAPDVVLAALVSNASATVYGGTTTINGTFTLPDKRPLADLPVRVEIKTATSDWVPLFSGKTNVNGLISAQVILGENTKARMISEGTWERAEGRSPELSIQVARKLSWIKVPTSMKRGTSYTLTAKIQPKIAGVTVTLNNGASGVSDANGEVSFTVSEKVTGFKRYQLTAQSDAKNLASTSEVVTVLVR